MFLEMLFLLLPMTRTVGGAARRLTVLSRLLVLQGPPDAILSHELIIWGASDIVRCCSLQVYPEGRMSTHLDKLKIGETMLFKGPKGRFTYTPNMKRAIGMPMLTLIC